MFASMHVILLKRQSDKIVYSQISAVSSSPLHYFGFPSCFIKGSLQSLPGKTKVFQAESSLITTPSLSIS